MPSAGWQYCCMPSVLGAACQILQQGAGSAPTCREHGTRLWQLDAKALKEVVTKCRAWGPVQCSSWQGKLGRIRRVPKERHVRNLL